MNHDDNPMLRYFDAEMRYLRDASREFAVQQPEVARRLGLTTTGGRDDRVEQAFQGFAFLMARLRMKLDDALPEITDPLIDNLWPHTARTIPSLAVLECVPSEGQARTLSTLPAGLQVRSSPIGTNGTVCVYRTTQPVRLLPLHLRGAGSAVRNDGRAVMRIEFDLLHGEQRVLDDLSRIRLYLHGERPTASALYAALTREVETIAVRVPGVYDGRLQLQSDMKIEAAGCGAETRLWPSDDARRNCKLDREQTMLEYFTFPEKFHFIDLCGFNASSLPAGETRLEFEIVLTGRLPGDITFGADNLRLHCTPVINLFEIDAKPLQPNAHERDYRVSPPDADAPHVEPYDAISVVAADLNTGRQDTYQSFKEFRHRGGMTRYASPQRYFHTAMRTGVTGERQMWITLGGQLWDTPDSLPDAHVTVRALACNGALPRMALSEATISEPASDFTGIQAVRNLTKPTRPLYPPSHRRYAWEILSHFSAHEINYLDAQVLRGVLGLYDWTRREENERRIAAIRDVWLEEKRGLSKGGLLRCLDIHVVIDPMAFAGPGDLVLFGDVLSHFIGRYASYAYSVQLVLIEGAGGRRSMYPRTDFTGTVM
ncbi:type VI secretion protein ImpG [Pandoraea terrae]|uniref:Type VI secretion protein ImpG n=1 Tax=Pandoraea terrae TaxID=1537710 RepID=A0A5E4TF03_9BURK|nr:type VI secretion system baseplate subunit TssF [Pandoraea terrae]VVD85523.1 type VI secretion protein ImpG [Pandoraea terrae]